MKKLLLILTLLFTFGIASAQKAKATIIMPSNQDTVKGVISIIVSGSGAYTYPATVELFVGDNPEFPEARLKTKSFPFTFQWNTESHKNEKVKLQTVVHTSTGKVITSEPIFLTIQ